MASPGTSPRHTARQFTSPLPAFSHEYSVWPGGHWASLAAQIVENPCDGEVKSYSLSILMRDVSSKDFASQGLLPSSRVVPGVLCVSRRHGMTSLQADPPDTQA